MRRALQVGARGLLAIALLGGLASGCGLRLLHRGGPAVASAPPAGDGWTTAPGKDHEKKQKRHGREPEPTFAGDPLGEARARAEAEPSEPWWPYRAAQLETAARQPAAAESSLRAALARDSTYAPALTHLSRLLYDQGRHEEAVRLLAPARDRRVTLEPADRAAALAGLALHEAALGQDDEARAALELLGRDARVDAAGVAAYLAVRGRSADSAAKLTEAALAAAPGSAANHNNRGIALLRAADPDSAAHEFERAIALDPSLPGPYYNLAILERWYRLDTIAASKRFQEYWTRSHADPDSLYPELGHGATIPVAEQGGHK